MVYSRKTVKLLCFHVAGQDFGVRIAAVKETLPERPLTRLGLVPSFVAGLINLRGEVVAVLDLARLLELDGSDGGAFRNDDSEIGEPGSARRAASRNIVILRANLLPGARDSRHAANRPAAGLLVDRLDGVRDLAPGEVKPPPPTLAVEPASYLDGVAAAGSPPRPLLLIAPERVLGSDRLRPFRRETR
jgi:chemotaxis signal transduction protein